jgi:hypothetical protein
MHMRPLIHRLMNVPGVLLFLAIAAQFWLLTEWAKLGHKVWPEADVGSCWTFALARWDWRHDWLCIRKAPGKAPIPHVALVHGELGGVTEQTDPVARRKGWEAVWHSLYFKYRVTRTER